MKKNIKAIVLGSVFFVLVLCVSFSSGTAAKRRRGELARTGRAGEQSSRATRPDWETCFYVV